MKGKAELSEVAKERGLIVRWLRRQSRMFAKKVPDIGIRYSVLLQYAADRIANQEYRRGPK